MKKLLDYLNGLQKRERIAFAKACGTSEGYLRKAISIGQKLSSDLCIKLERESERLISCEDLRPDVDWPYLRSTSNEAKTTLPSQSPSGKKIREASDQLSRTKPKPPD